jgi:hypothetical protein
MKCVVAKPHEGKASPSQRSHGSTAPRDFFCALFEKGKKMHFAFPEAPKYHLEPPKTTKPTKVEAI